MEKIKIGVFGVRRGRNYVDIMAEEQDSIEIVALCDWDVNELGSKDVVPNAKLFTNYDEFLAWGKENGMNAVFLANYFHEHAQAAIKAMEAGMNVISECTAGATLKDCVELVEAVEKTGKKYMLAENYQYSMQLQTVKEYVKSGALGSVLLGEGEYNHAGTAQSVYGGSQGRNHWRAYLARTYYNTHALGPVMYITDSMPLYVSGRAAHSDYLFDWREYRHNYDGAGMMFCEMDNGMIARVTGCTGVASDYSRYRFVGDVSSCECGYRDDGKIRVFRQDYMKADPSIPIEELLEPHSTSEKADQSGHGGADYWVVQAMIGYFRDGKDPFYDVYRSVAMSAVAILGWRSALNHGENYRIPNFRSLKERNAIRDDDLTPFVDDNGVGNTLPASAPFNEGTRPISIREAKSRLDRFITENERN